MEKLKWIFKKLFKKLNHIPVPELGMHRILIFRI